jgi:sugar O-acyltransferase (sialic acid O-acetyltransferase NeuD family)
MKKIAIYGSKGFGFEIKSLIDQINQVSPKFEFIGFFDDAYKKGDELNGQKLLGGIKDLNQIDYNLDIVFAIGNPKIKKQLSQQIRNTNISHPVLIHPSAILSTDRLNIGKGTIITANNVVTVNINIGEHVLINWSCTVGHDSTIGSFSSIMPSVNISGEVNIGEGVFCGTGAKIINQTNIGAYSIIGAGAVVTNDIPKKCTAVGIPANPIKFHE